MLFCTMNPQLTSTPPPLYSQLPLGANLHLGGRRVGLRQVTFREKAQTTLWKRPFLPRPVVPWSTLLESPCLSSKPLLTRRFRVRSPVLARGARRKLAASTVTNAPTERFHLGNIGPQPGSRKRNKRKGRGISAGQGASCGFGMRGQKSRSGPGVRPGFEGGQTPLYRRLPKLRGIAGGMGAGLPKFVTVNLSDIASAGFCEGDEVSLESLKIKRVINPSGRDAKLQLKVLGNGELSTKLSIKAGAFSGSAKEKLEAVGCTLTTVPGRKKWVKPSVAKNQARAIEYFAQKFSSN